MYQVLCTVSFRKLSNSAELPSTYQVLCTVSFRKLSNSAELPSTYQVFCTVSFRKLSNSAELPSTYQVLCTVSFRKLSNSAELPSTYQVLCTVSFRKLSNSAELPSTYQVLCTVSFRKLSNSAELPSTYQVLCTAIFRKLPIFIETSITKSVFFWYQSQRDLHLFCKFRMRFTWTRNMEKSSYHDEEFSSYRQKWVKVWGGKENNMRCLLISELGERYLLSCHINDLLILFSIRFVLFVFRLRVMALLGLGGGGENNMWDVY